MHDLKHRMQELTEHACVQSTELVVLQERDCEHRETEKEREREMKRKRKRKE